jgi:hypothetical protein
MSIRTLVEINHDYLGDCDIGGLGMMLKAGEKDWIDGVKVLGQRHHSDPDWPTGTRFETDRKGNIVAISGYGYFNFSQRSASLWMGWTVGNVRVTLTSGQRIRMVLEEPRTVQPAEPDTPPEGHMQENKK